MLGQGRIELDGQALTRLISPKHQAIVYFLAAGEAPAARSRLAALLWGGLDEPAARANLRVALTGAALVAGLLDIDDRQVAFTANTGARRLAQGHRGAAQPTDQARLRQAAAAGAVRCSTAEIAGNGEFSDWLAQSRRRACDVVELRRGLQRASAGGRRDAAIACCLLGLTKATRRRMALMRCSPPRPAHGTSAIQICRAGSPTGSAHAVGQCYALYMRIHAEHTAQWRRPPRDWRRRRRGGGAARPRRCSHRPRCDAAAIDAAALSLPRPRERTRCTRAALDPRCRWLTIIGPGGVGKTRLAQAVPESLRTCPTACCGSTGVTAAAPCATARRPRP
jgi:hypothetical protein